MTITLHGKVRGRTIELDDDPRLDEGQQVEIQMRVVPPVLPHAPMIEGLTKAYEILSRRHSSGHTDTAERHNEHQP